VLQITTALAAKCARHNVQVNAMVSGAFETVVQSAVLESLSVLESLRKFPAHRMGRTEEIGPLICFLAGAEADLVTGSVLVVDGGESTKLERCGLQSRRPLALTVDGVGGLCFYANGYQ
jgi:2-deoxy-D-gluconate 3-dehydrogenase